jgi:hypothetical protein
VAGERDGAGEIILFEHRNLLSHHLEGSSRLLVGLPPTFQNSMDFAKPAGFWQVTNAAI